jgi:Fe-S-cluster-containing hydrogenase component 2
MKHGGLKPVLNSFDEIKRCPGYPSDERLAHGKVAVIECIQDIPCNPCEDVCPKGAIKIGKPITNLPVFTGELCDGCGKCIAICPGLAVFIVDNTYSENEACVTIPYEMLQLPQKGEIVDALDRNGKVVCDGRVIGVQNPKSFDRTAVIIFVVPKQYSHQVRNIKKRKLKNE